MRTKFVTHVFIIVIKRAIPHTYYYIYAVVLKIAFVRGN